MSPDPDLRSAKTFPTAEPWAPLDRRWCAVVKVAGRTIGDFGVTREDALENLRAKLAALQTAKESQ